MMTFETIGKTSTATNSLKPVMIQENFAGQFMLLTPEGRLDDDFTSAGPFVTFDEAKRNAEMTVGMSIKWEF